MLTYQLHLFDQSLPRYRTMSAREANRVNEALPYGYKFIKTQCQYARLAKRAAIADKVWFAGNKYRRVVDTTSKPSDLKPLACLARQSGMPHATILVKHIKPYTEKEIHYV